MSKTTDFVKILLQKRDIEKALAGELAESDRAILAGQHVTLAHHMNDAALALASSPASDDPQSDYRILQNCGAFKEAVAVNVGALLDDTAPSRTIREAVISLSALHQASLTIQDQCLVQLAADRNFRAVARKDARGLLKQLDIAVREEQGKPCPSMQDRETLSALLTKAFCEASGSAAQISALFAQAAADHPALQTAMGLFTTLNDIVPDSPLSGILRSSFGDSLSGVKETAFSLLADGIVDKRSDLVQAGYGYMNDHLGRKPEAAPQP